MDLDIEMDDAVDAVQIPYNEPLDIIPAEEQEPGEVDETYNGETEDPQSDENQLVLNKVHVRGLDTFNPEEVKAYVAEKFGGSPVDRIEWIDDTSANLLFRTDSIAQEAIIGLAAVEIADATQLPPLQLIPAKPFSGKPECTLHIRFAVVGDRKQQGAAARSRFYLLHPEYDPEERKRDGNRYRYRDRDSDGRYGRDRYRARDRREDHYGRDEVEEFDVNLYDDDSTSLANRISREPRPRRVSASPASSSDGLRSSTRRNQNKELFPGRLPRDRNGTMRGRSASPARDRDGDQAMEDRSRGRSRNRSRDRSRNRSRERLRDRSRDRQASARNREKALSLKERLAKENDGNSGKELFPSKINSSSSATGKAQMDQIDDSHVLASERTIPFPKLDESSMSTSGFNIRGIAAKRTTDQGITIKGTGTVRELFPEKFGNAGKELFAEKLEGRGRRRQRAEDLFH